MNIKYEEFRADELKEMAKNVYDEVSRLQEYCFYDNDDYFFSDNYYNDYIRLLEDVDYGDYRVNDSYVRFDEYGNLNSVDEYEMDEILEDNAEEIVNEYIEILDYIDDDDSIKIKVLDMMKPKLTKDEVYEKLRVQYHLCNETKIGDIKKMYKNYDLGYCSLGKQIDYLYRRALNEMKDDMSDDTYNEILEDLDIEYK